MGEREERVLELSKDIGKVAERTARLEEGFGRFEKRMDEFMTAASERDEQFKTSLGKIDNHMGQVCSFANFGKAFLKWSVPPGTLLGFAVFGRAMGWW